MNEGKKRPPINLDEVGKDQKAEKGSISYTETPKEGKKTSSIVQVLMAALIAVVLSALLVVTYSPKKADLSLLGQKLDEISLRMNGIDSSIGAERSRIENLINSQVNYATKGDIAALQNLPAEMNSQFATLEGSLGERITALETRLTELEAQEEEEELTSDAITCELKSWGDVAVPKEATSLDTTYKVAITNNTGGDLEDVIFTFVVKPQPALSDIQNVSLTGGYASWVPHTTSPWCVVFQNSWGFDLDANDTRKIMLSLHLEFEGATQPTWFESEIEVEDYDTR